MVRVSPFQNLIIQISSISGLMCFNVSHCIVSHCLSKSPDDSVTLAQCHLKAWICNLVKSDRISKASWACFVLMDFKQGGPQSPNSHAKERIIEAPSGRILMPLCMEGSLVC